MSDKTNKRLAFLINAAYICILALVIYILFKYILRLIMPFIIAFCIASIVQPLIKYIKLKFKTEQKAVAIFVMVLVYVSIGMLIIWLITQITVFITQLFARVPEYYNEIIHPNISVVLEKVSFIINGLPPEWQQGFNFNDMQSTIISTLQDIAVNISQRGLSAISSLTSSIPIFIVAFLFTIMLSFFMSTQYDELIAFLKKHIPKQTKSVLSDVKSVFRDTVFKYINACFILMFITFTILFIGFLILNIPNAFIIALGIAIFDALPVFGTGGIVIPWAIVELIQGNVSDALELAILYGVITLVRNILEPKIVGNQLGLNPIVSLMSIYLGFRLFGVFGMIISPIVVQMICALQKKGTINIFNVSSMR